MSGRPVSKWRVLAAVFGLGLAADQVSKFLAVDRLTTAFSRAGASTIGEKIVAFWRLRSLEALEPGFYVYRPLWRMHYTENPNAAFGFLAFLPAGARYTVFVIISIAAVAFVLHYYRRVEERQRLLQVALALVLAGTVGNLVDRLARRYVIDFVDWYWWNRPDLLWPTFNVADSMLVVGIGAILLLPQRHTGIGPGGGAGNRRSGSGLL